MEGVSVSLVNSPHKVLDGVFVEPDKSDKGCATKYSSFGSDEHAN
jgi:hypothetical protein